MHNPNNSRVGFDARAHLVNGDPNAVLAPPGVSGGTDGVSASLHSPASLATSGAVGGEEEAGASSCAAAVGAARAGLTPRAPAAVLLASDASTRAAAATLAAAAPTRAAAATTAAVAPAASSAAAAASVAAATRVLASDASSTRSEGPERAPSSTSSALAAERASIVVDFNSRLDLAPTLL